MINISNTSPRSRRAADSAANNNNNVVSLQSAATQPAFSGSQQFSGAQASRAAEAARNRLIGNYPPTISAQLRPYLDAVGSNPRSANAPVASAIPGELSSPPLSSASPGRALITASIPDPDSLGRQEWRFAPADKCDKLVEAFNTFQARLTRTADYENEELRSAMIGRVDALVTAMREAPELRNTCFSIAQKADRGYEDADATTLALNEMVMAKIGHDVQTGAADGEQLRTLGIGFFKLHVLNELASAEIARLQGAGIPIHEVEIRLLYRVALRSRLNLPGIAHSMRWGRAAQITHAKIDAAAAEVESRLQGRALDEFLAQWTPWQQAMGDAKPLA